MDWNDFVGITEKADEVPAAYLIERIKIWRDAELVATDFTQLPDVKVDKVAFAKYRQELRNLSSQDDDPRQWVFPVKP
jgi:Fe-S-cluster formation regulator IscX/YfhJ